MWKLRNISIFLFILLLAFNVKADDEINNEGNDDSANAENGFIDNEVTTEPNQDYGSDDNNSADNNDNENKTGHLCTAFRELRSVVPKYSLLGITAAHYSADAEFRNAIAFLGTKQFKVIIQKIENSEDFKAIMKLFSDAGVDTTDFANYSTLFECLLLDEVKIIQGRSLNTYASDIRQAIPRKAFKKQIAKELKANEQFKKFYGVVRSKSYKDAVLTAFASKKIKSELAYLRNHKIDLRQLTLDIIIIFQMGPKPTKC